MNAEPGKDECRMMNATKEEPQAFNHTLAWLNGKK
jgi:hypothetical protein